MSEDIALPFDLPSVCRKKLSVGFDGGRLSSDAGVLLLRGVERKLGLAGRLASCIRDKRAPDLIEHSIEEMLKLRMFAIAAGYEDADDCDSLRHDPIFKMAVGRLPRTGEPLCSQPTMSRLENAPSKIEIARAMAAMVDQFCESYGSAPASITLDIDDTFDAVHGHQQLSLFNAHYDERGFLPIHIYEGTSGKPVAVILREGKTPAGMEVRTILKHVMTEPFSQWVVEDRFPSGRPPLELAGVQLVADVRPFELMKLRMLNGSHSTIAYLGYLGGYEHVNEAITDAAIRTLIYELMTDEVMSTLPDHFYDLGAYRDALLKRFRNPALRHRTWQIAMDGSQKLPQRLLGTISDRLARGLPVTRAALGVAAWMRYVTGIDEKGSRIDVRDPLASRLRTTTDSAGGSPEAIVDGLLGVTEIFGDDLPRNDSFRAELTGHLSSLLHRGAIETTRRVCARDVRQTQP